jgi:hypothetical protein
LTEIVLFGPESFIRGTGKPVTVAKDFSVQQQALSYSLRVQNGSPEGEAQVSSATVSLNGSEILGQKDFSQKTRIYEKPVTLNEDNSLNIKLNSVPGSYLVVSVIGYYNAEDPDIDNDGDGFSENDGDCNDADREICPDAVEVCDGVDNNCNGIRDEGLLNVCGLCGPDLEETCDEIDNDCDGDIDEGCPGRISVAVLSPLNNATITEYAVDVYGVFAGTPSIIMVNEVEAVIDGDTFFAAAVPLSPGENTIAVYVADDSGNTASESIMVNAARADHAIRLTANVTSGLPPLKTTIRIHGLFGSLVPEVSYAGPGDAFIEIRDQDEYDVTIEEEGAFAFTAQVTDGAGNVSTDTIELVVLPRSQMDAILRATWSGMKDRLASKDVEGALEFFIPQSREGYRRAFILIIDELPKVVADMSDIELIYLVDDTAKCRLRRIHDIDGVLQEITYYIYFVRDYWGDWKIQQF